MYFISFPRISRSTALEMSTLTITPPT